VHADDPYAGAMDHKDLVQDAKKQVSDSNGNGDEQPTPKKTSPDDYGSSDSSDSDDSDSADDTESDGS
jgi:U3 small nucleolar RNA-associated protein 14